MSSDKSHQCSFCNQSYSTVYYLKKHSEKCKDKTNYENTFKCIYCNKVYFSTYTLQSHYNVCKNKCVSNLETKLKEKDELIKSIETENKQLKNTIIELELKAKEYEIEQKYFNEFKENYKELLGKVNTTINNTYTQNSNNNITMKQVVSNLEPISYDDIKNSMPLFTNEYIDDGLVGFARFLCEHSCNNKIITSDKSRNTIVYRTKFNDFIKDPECLNLINKTLQDNSEEIIRKTNERKEYYRELMDMDDEFDTYLKRGTRIHELKRLTESSLSEKPDENIKMIANVLCKHGVKTYQKAIEKIKV